MTERQLEFEDLLIRKAMERELQETPAEPPAQKSGFRFLHALKRLAHGRGNSRETSAGTMPRV